VSLLDHKACDTTFGVAIDALRPQDESSVARQSLELEVALLEMIEVRN